MKRIFLSFFLLIGFVTYSQNQYLLGKWARCKTSCNGLSNNYNVCTYLTFKENDVLIVEFPGKTEYLTWKVDKGFLKITSSNLKNSSFFEFDKLYEFTYNNQQEVLLFEKGNPNCYEMLIK